MWPKHTLVPGKQS